jgi:hypothetical protein
MMRQALYKRLEGFEKVSAAAAQRARERLPMPELERLAAIVDAWAGDPRPERLLAESPPEFLGKRPRQELRERASRCS